MTLEEDSKLLEAVRNWRPSGQLHDIAKVAYELYARSGNKLTQEDADKLNGILEAYEDDLYGLAEAMEGLIRFYIYIDRPDRDPEGAKIVGKVLKEHGPKFEPFWQRVAEAMANVSEDQRMSFGEFLAQRTEDQKTAPQYGAKPPEGTIPLKNLVTPRPPPWAAKAGKGPK